MKLESLLNSMFESQRRKPRLKTTLAGLRKRAAVLGVTIEAGRDGVGRYYVLDGTGWEDDNFCTSHDEIADKLDRIASERK